jgi:hypothetical protein
LESPKAAIGELRVRIADGRQRAASADFKGTQEQRRAELKSLDALSKRLAGL